MLKILIVDNETHCRNQLKLQLAKYSEGFFIKEADSLTTGIKEVKTTKPDLVFLDIDLADGTGFDLLQEFPNPTFQVIFATAFNEFAIKAFKHSALDYLLKPIEQEDLAKALDKVMAIEGMKNQNEQMSLLLSTLKSSSFSKIAIPQMDSISFIEKDKIVCCESDVNYTLIYTSDNQKVMSTNTLKRMDELLQEHYFFRVHKSFIVNVNFIEEISKSEGGIIKMTNGTTVPIARRRRDLFFEKIGLK